MPITYIPMILDQSTLPDGEGAQILGFLAGSSPPTAVVASGGSAKSYRKGHMRLVFLLQWSDIAGADLGQCNLVLRSPFPDDDGDQTNRPIVLVAPASTNITGVNGVIAQPLGGAPTLPPTSPAADFAATFNGKAIPNWSIQFNTFGDPDPGEASVWVHVLWGHTVGN